MPLKFDTTFQPAYGEAVAVAPGVQRITAPNPSPFTFHGTNSYLIGSDTLAVIDPGPDDDSHLNTLLAAIAGRPVSQGRGVEALYLERGPLYESWSEYSCHNIDIELTARQIAKEML